MLSLFLYNTIELINVENAYKYTCYRTKKADSKWMLQNPIIWFIFSKISHKIPKECFERNIKYFKIRSLWTSLWFDILRFGSMMLHETTYILYFYSIYQGSVKGFMW